MRGASASRIATILLAAGGSRRMAGAHKLLEVVEDRTVVAWSVSAAVSAALGPVIVVTGCRASEIAATLPPGVHLAHNPDWREGMATSLRAGVAALPPSMDAVAVALGDMPALRASHYRRLASRWSPGRIVVPTHRGRRGHPVVWPAPRVVEFGELLGDAGAKSLLARHADTVVEVPYDDPAVVFDVDDADDLERARLQLRNRTMDLTTERTG